MLKKKIHKMSTKKKIRNCLYFKVFSEISFQKACCAGKCDPQCAGKYEEEEKENHGSS